MRKECFYIIMCLLISCSGDSACPQCSEKLQCGLLCSCDLVKGFTSVGGWNLKCSNNTNKEEYFTLTKSSSGLVSVYCHKLTPYEMFKSKNITGIRYVQLVQCLPPNMPFADIFKDKNLQILEFNSKLTLRALNPFLFKGFALTELILSNNGLYFLDDTIFEGLTNLTNLVLSNNEFQIIKSNLFVSLHNLTNLRLDNNIIKQLSEKVFTGLEKLKTLFLSSNRLKSLPSKIFNYLHSLEHLYLSKNNLKRLPSNLLANSPRLKKLHLNINELTYIPQSFFQNNLELQELNIGDNPLKFLSENLLLGLKNLQNISLHNCNLSNIPDKFFQNADSSNFEMLQMWNNRLTVLPPELFGKLGTLKHLDLTFNDVTSLTNYPFPQNFQLNFLSLKKNNLTEITEGIFDQLISLATLDLSFNFIEKIDGNAFSKLRKLEKLNLRGNFLVSFEGNYPFGSSTIINTIDISENKLTAFPDLNWPLYNSLKELKANNNKIKFFNVPVIQSKSPNISLQNNKIALINVNDVKNYEYLFDDAPKFYISNNSFKCDCHLLDFVNFISNSDHNVPRFAMFPDENELRCFEPSSLKGSVIKNVDKKEFICRVSENCSALCDCFFRGSDQETVVNCNNQNLSQFPAVAPTNTSILHLENNQLSSLGGLESKLWNNLRELYLDNNNIVSNEWYLPPKLIFISLQNNKLTWLAKSFMTHAASQKSFRLKLSSNLWKCDCSIKEFKEWLTVYQQVLDKQNITCGDNNTAILKLTDEDICPSTKWEQNVLISATAGSAVLIIIFITLLIYYRNKQTVIAYMYIHFYNVFICFYNEKDIDEDKLFDAFVSYSSADRDTVLALLNGLENNEPHFKLCIHERDWMPGNLISWNIAESVQNSKKTILILSADFLKSIWFQVEFHTAYYQMLEDKIDRLIVIVKGKLPPKETLDKDLQFLLSTKTYLIWGEKWFWEKLRYAMPHRKSSVVNRLPLPSRREPKLIKTVEDQISLFKDQASMANDSVSRQDSLEMQPQRCNESHITSVICT